MKKKVLLIPLALLLAISLVAIGCPAPAPPTPAPPAPAPPAPAPPKPAEVFEWRMQCFLGPGMAEWDVLVPRFVERVKVMSGGRIDITPYPPGALVSTFDMVDAVGKGVVEVGYGATVYWRGMMPFCEPAWGVPMALAGYPEHHEYLWWELGLLDLTREEFAKHNVYFLVPLWSDEWGSTMSTKPLKTLADFKGLKIRSFGMVGDIWIEYGASIVTLPGEEIYPGLATGVIDACNWGSPYVFVASKHHEVAKYYLTPSLISGDIEDLFMNLDVWNDLPSDLQEILIQAGRIFAIERASFSDYASCEAIGVMKEAGVTVSRLPDADLALIKEKAMQLLDERAKIDAPTAKCVELIKEAMRVYDIRR